MKCPRPQFLLARPKNFGKLDTNGTMNSRNVRNDEIINANVPDQDVETLTITTSST